MPEIQINEGIPTPDEFLSLRRSVNWPIPDEEAVARAMAGTTYGVTAQVNGKTVGMVRVVGDGSLTFLVHDLVVHPDYQRQGIGTRLMDALMAYVNKHARRKAYIATFSAPGIQHFYSRYGFVERPGKSGAPGMVYFKD